MSVSLYGSGNTVIQVVQSASTSGSTTDSSWGNGNMTATTGIQIASASITPQATTSKILVTFNCAVGLATNSTYAFALFRGTTLLSQQNLWYSTTSNERAFCMLSAYDSPSTTSSTTYSIRVSGNGGNALYYGTLDGSMTTSTTYTTQPGLVLMEISGS